MRRVVGPLKIEGAGELKRACQLCYIREVISMNLEKTAHCLNILGHFLGMRDVPELTGSCLKKAYGIEKADLLILFGGSIIAGGDTAAEAMKNKAAEKLVIAGGEGHTTESLRQKAAALVPGLMTDGLPEAEVFSRYIRRKYGIEADALETASTNCGNNVTNVLKLIQEKGYKADSLIIIQDASMQRRMDAGFRKYCGENTKLINYAAYKAETALTDGRLGFKTDIAGMWDLERYATLLMGEIPRLCDDSSGYGPAGAGFIAHVDIPDEVKKAFDYLKENGFGAVRKADPAYATKQEFSM